MTKHHSIYVRVSSKSQDLRSQLPDLERWADAQEQPIKFYTDHASGKNMDRPGWNKLEQAMRSGKVATICVWRIDRLGRTASGLTALFDELQQRRINLVSLKDGVDLSTPAGRMMANVLASVAQFEKEVRAERQAAGIEAARTRGVRWGGSVAGVRKKVTDTQVDAILDMNSRGVPKARIAAALHLSRPTVYSVLQ